MNEELKKYQPYLDFIDDYYKASNAATGSKFDSNANVEQKNVTTATGELYKHDAIGINRLRMYKKITELYGEDLAEEYIRQLDKHEIYRHDETSPLTPYCVSITLYPFLFGGLQTLGGNSGAPHNLDSFAGSFCNLLYMVAAQFAGACLYKNQRIKLYDRYSLIEPTIKDFVDSYNLDKQFVNEQGLWSYADISNDHMYAVERGSIVKINKVYRRKYDGLIYEIETANGQKVRTSADHKFKLLIDGKGEAVKADLLNVGDEVFCDIDYRRFVSIDSTEYNAAVFEGSHRREGTQIERTSLTWKAGYLDGLCMAYGYPDNGSIVLSSYNKKLIEDAQELVCRFDLPRPIIQSMSISNGPTMFTFTMPTAMLKYLKNARQMLPDVGIDYATPETTKIVSIKTMPNDDDYVYEIETETHWYNCGGLITHNCSTPEWLSYMDYFIRKEYGDDYYTHTDDVVDMSSRHRTIDKMICDKFEQVVYTLNAPAGARNLQSIFWNIAYFDKPYFEGMFENFVFPDGTPMQWESVSWLQKRFMRWLNNERTKRVLTFPVETLNLLDDGTDYVDKEWADYAAQMLSEGHSFFIYRSNSVDSLASCCFSGGTVFLTADGKKHRFNDYKDGDEVKVISPITHELCVAHVRQYGLALMQDITFRVGDTTRVVTATPNHEWILMGGKRTKELKVGDALWGNLYKVESIKPCEGTQVAWCLEVDDETHAFYLDGAVPTGNCRLRNEMQDNTFSYTLGAGGVATGSKGVITINMNRLIQNCTAMHEDVIEAVREQVRKIHKYLTAFNELLKEEFTAKLLPVYDAGYISLEKQYLTIGINGFVEGCEFLGYDISPDDERYIEFTNKVLTAIYEENRATRTDELMFNTEYVPRMSGHEAA